MRKGFLAAAAFALASSSAFAQFGPVSGAPAPFVPGPAPRNPAGYLPPGLFPGSMTPSAPFPVATPLPAAQPAAISPVARTAPAAPAPAPAAPSSVIIHETAPVIVNDPSLPPAPFMLPPPPPAHARSHSHGKGHGPSAYFDWMAKQTAEPVVFHRTPNECAWFGFDYLMSWIRNGPIERPLLTTSVSTNDAVDRGAIDAPGTIPLFGGSDLRWGVFSGIRLETGMWLDHDNHYSLDASFFYLFPRHIGLDLVSNGSTILARPIFNVAAGNFDEDVFLIAGNDSIAGRTIAGRINIDARSEIYGGELNGRWHGYYGSRLHAEALGGFRALRFAERLRITDSSTPVQAGFVSFQGNPLAQGDILTENDSFDCGNTFYGFQVGGRLRWEGDWFFVDGFAKVGIGLTYQNIDIDGSTTVSSGGVVIAGAPGGILALPSNIGEYDRTRFGVVPEVGVNFGVELTDNVRLKAGYSFLVWSGVARPGLQIDNNVNVGQVNSEDALFGASGGLPGPRALLREQSFWMHTLNFGLEFHY